MVLIALLYNYHKKGEINIKKLSLLILGTIFILFFTEAMQHVQAESSSQGEADVIKDAITELEDANNQATGDLAVDEQITITRANEDTLSEVKIGELEKEVKGKVLEVELKNGTRHHLVVHLKEMLQNLGYGSFGLTNFYGPLTEQQVKRFQRHHGLAETGLVSPELYRMITAIDKDAFKQGDRLKEVITLKENLRVSGYWNSRTGTTLYGPETARQVLAYQKAHGLPESARADKLTRDHIKQRAESRLTSPMYREDAITLKIHLEQLGFGSFLKTDFYGPQTKASVEAFQKAFQLPINGRYDLETERVLNELINSPLRLGQRNDATKALKQKLYVIGYWPNANGTELFGSQTEIAVKDFQTAVGLRPTGVVDKRTSDQLEKQINQPLKRGMYRADAIDVKSQLMDLGFGTFLLTDFFGPATERELKAFQRSVSLNATGVVDTNTLNALKVATAGLMVRGNHYQEAIQLKRDLYTVGLWPENGGTTLFGAGTETAIKSFQQSVGLPVTGRVNKDTRLSLSTVATGPLKRGMFREDVLELKTTLARLGFGVLPHDDHFSLETVRAVESFQTYYGLNVTGTVNQHTRTLLSTLENNALRLNKTGSSVEQLHKDLDLFGFTVTTNNQRNFSKATENQLKAFQKHYQLRVNGVLDPKTETMFQNLKQAAIQIGQRSEKIRSLKEQLIYLGFGEGISTTTLYGTQTASNVRAFQKQQGLPVSGVIDFITQEAIESATLTKPILIVLDPGHGGRDPGAVSRGLTEKNVVLTVSNEAKRYLEANFKGVRVEVTRSTDVYLSLTDRAAFANRLSADYFVSLHMNAHNGAANGFESFIFNGGVSQETIRRQQDIHRYLTQQMGVNDRGMKRANFSVLRNTQMPALLIEYLFIDHPEDNKKLQDSNYLRWLGRITAESIASSYNLPRK